MHTSQIPETGRLVNLLGALALASVDAIDERARSLELHSNSDVAALNLVGHAPGISIDFLADAIGLSHPGTVRLVDRLADAQLMERKSGKDRRTIALYLTSEGRKMRRTLQRGRLGELESLLAPLNADERSQLERLVEKMLDGHVHDIPTAAAVCRLCDERVCVPCPMNTLAGD